MTKENIQQLLQYMDNKGYRIHRVVNSPSLYNKRSVTEEEIDELINNYIDEIHRRGNQNVSNQNK